MNIYRDKPKGNAFSGPPGYNPYVYLTENGQKVVHDVGVVHPAITTTEAARLAGYRTWWLGVASAAPKVGSESISASRTARESDEMGRMSMKPGGNGCRPELLLAEVRPGVFFNSTFKVRSQPLLHRRRGCD